MQNITLGSTGITAPQNGFGALPIQRVGMTEAAEILGRAYQGGMRFFDTARAYTDSEEKIGLAFGKEGSSDWGGLRSEIFLATKTQAKTPESFWKDLETSLSKLKTDYVDIYQFHQMARCWRPGDGTGMYECMQEAKAQGKIRHIGATAHRIDIAMEIVESGLYETMQFPFSYLSGEKELQLLEACRKQNMGFIAMKSLAGGLITRSDAAMAYFTQFDNAMPIWGIQRMRELEEWLSFMEDTPVMTPEREAFIRSEKEELAGEFCRGCGYCMPCPQGITINQCARISLLLRRAPSRSWLSEHWQEEMKKIETCTGCRACAKKCPYGLPIPELLKKNYEDYKKVLAGEVSVQ